MLLNAENIIDKKLLSDTIAENFGNASYDLSIGTIITMEDKSIKKGEYQIPPQGMVIAVSKETFKMPKNVIGFTTIKNSLSSKGILALNIGLVDPTWEGPISSVLINFGRKKTKISLSDRFLRMTFFDFESPIQDKTYHLKNSSKSEYIDGKRKDASAYFDDTFLNLKAFKKDLKSYINIYLLKLVGVISVSIAALAFAFNAIVNINKYAGPDVEKIKESINCIQKSDSIRFRLQDNKIDSMKNIIDSLKLIDKTINGK